MEGKYRVLFFIVISFNFINIEGKTSGSGSINKNDKNEGTASFLYRDAVESPLANLSQNLFRSYVPNVRPYCPNRTLVNIDFAINQLIEIDEPSQMLTINLWMRLSWNDCYLRWDPDEFDGIKLIQVPNTFVWLPDLAVWERVSEEFYGLHDFPVKIYHDGTVKYNFQTTIESFCPIEVTMFPFDTQVCPLTMSSWVHNGFQMNVTSLRMEADLSLTKENVEWIIADAPAIRHEYMYLGEPYPDVTFFIYLVRKPNYYVLNIIVPAVLITCIAALGFILPVDSGEKVGLELTVMLTMSIFQLLVADKLPASSEGTPWIVVYMTFTLILCALSCVAQVIVLNVYHRQNEMSKGTVFYVLQPLSTLTLVEIPGFTHCRCKQKEANYDVTEKKGDNFPENEVLWKAFAQCLDRLGLMLFCASFAIGTVILFLEFVQ